MPEEVAEQRRQRLRAEAHDHGREPSEETLYLAGWIIVVTNVPPRMLSLAETLVVLTVRWQIELLFRLWKEDGQIDEWRSSKRWRILCELYAKLAAMLIQHWLIEVGCWHDPQRSLVKAAQVVRREAGQLMVAIREGRVERVVRQIMGCMRSGCRIEKRKQFPSTDAGRQADASAQGEQAPRSVPTLAGGQGVGVVQAAGQDQLAGVFLNLMPMGDACVAPHPVSTSFPPLPTGDASVPTPPPDF